MIGPLVLGVKFRDTKSDLRFGDAMLRLMPAGATLKIPYRLPRSMEYRCAAFERALHRPPTDFEFYILWNAPAQVQRPSKAVSKRAERFSNLTALE